MPDLEINKQLVAQIYSANKSEQKNAADYIVNNYDSSDELIKTTLVYVKNHAVFLGQESYSRCLKELMQKDFFNNHKELLNLYSQTISNVARSRKKGMALDLYITWLTCMPFCNIRKEWLRKNIGLLKSSGLKIIPDTKDTSSITANKITSCGLLKLLAVDVVQCASDRYSGIIRLFELCAKKIMFASTDKHILTTIADINNTLHDAISSNTINMAKASQNESHLLWFIMECSKRHYLSPQNMPSDFLHLMYKNINPRNRGLFELLNDSCMAQIGMSIEKIQAVYPDDLLYKTDTWRALTSKITYDDSNQIPEM